MTQKEIYYKNFEIALSNVLLAKDLAIQWDLSKKKNFVQEYSPGLSYFIYSKDDIEIFFKAIFVKLESRLSKHRKEIVDKYFSFIRLFKKYENKFIPKDIIRKEDLQMNQADRLKLYNVYKEKIAFIIKYYNNNSKLYLSCIEEINSKFDLHLSINFLQFKDYLNSTHYKAKNCVEGYMDISFTKFKEAIDFMYTTCKKDEEENTPKEKIKETNITLNEVSNSEDNKIEEKWTKNKVSQVVDAYIEYLKFMYKPQRKQLLIEIKIPNITIELDRLESDQINSMLENYLLYFKNSDKLDVKAFERAISLFDKYYEIYCKIKENKDAGYEKRKAKTREKKIKNPELYIESLNNLQEMVKDMHEKEENKTKDIKCEEDVKIAGEKLYDTLMNERNVSEGLTKRVDLDPMKQEIKDIREENTLENISMIINLINKIPLRNRMKFSRDILNFEITNLNKYL